MSREAIESFFKAASRNEDLREKLAALQKQPSETLAEGLAALSAEADVPVTVREWQLFLEKTSSGKLSDQDLQAIAGGGFFPTVQDQPK